MNKIRNYTSDEHKILHKELCLQIFEFSRINPTNLSSGAPIRGWNERRFLPELFLLSEVRPQVQRYVAETCVTTQTTILTVSDVSFGGLVNSKFHCGSFPLNLTVRTQLKHQRPGNLLGQRFCRVSEGTCMADKCNSKWSYFVSLFVTQTLITTVTIFTTAAVKKLSSRSVWQHGCHVGLMSVGASHR